MDQQICVDIELFGNCTKKELCEVCNKRKKPILSLNVNSDEYIPKKKLAEQKVINDRPNFPEKLNLNLEAKEYTPKFVNPNANNYIVRQMDSDDENMFDDDEENNKEVEVIVRDIIENEEIEDDESDEEKWFPKYKDCDCCQGFIYKCSGKACENLQYCYCKVKTECDDFY